MYCVQCIGVVKCIKVGLFVNKGLYIRILVVPKLRPSKRKPWHLSLVPRQERHTMLVWVCLTSVLYLVHCFWIDVISTHTYAYFILSQIYYIVLFVVLLEESLSIPIMVSMTPCPKQLVKQLWRLPNSFFLTWPTCESFLNDLNDFWWTLLKTLQHTHFCVPCIIHSIHSCMTWIEYHDLANY